MSTPDSARYVSLGSTDGAVRWGYYGWVFLLAVLVLLGLYCAHTVEQAGHQITGMNNQVVWGLPHVFAISLIVSASGALNAASLSSVFGQVLYQPWSRLSVLLAISLLMGGLLVLVLDLGRPDRLIVAMTHYNFRSIFSWNIFLYTGFIVLGLVYLWMMMERRYNRYTGVAGSVMFVWRIVLTSGTGCIFGFLVARDALDTALMAPLFIALSLVMGTAVFCLLLLALQRTRLIPPDEHNAADDHGVASPLLRSQARLLFWFLLALAYLSVTHHLTNLYVAEHQATEGYILSGPMAGWFWVGHVLLGLVTPLLLLRFLTGTAQAVDVRRLMFACLASIAGGWCLLYSVIIGSQSTPQSLFPDKIVLSSRFGDAFVESYSASVWEWGLGFGGVALAGLLFSLALRVLPFLPSRQS